MLANALTAQSGASVIQPKTAKPWGPSIRWPAGDSPDKPGIKTMSIKAIAAAAEPVRWGPALLREARTATSTGDSASVVIAKDDTRRAAASVRWRTLHRQWFRSVRRPLPGSCSLPDPTLARSMGQRPSNSTSTMVTAPGRHAPAAESAQLESQGRDSAWPRWYCVASTGPALPGLKLWRNTLKILVPIDGSEPALEAVRHVLGLSGNGLKTRLVLATVQDSVCLYEMVLPPDADVLEPATGAVGTPALAAAEAPCKAAAVPYDREIVSGDAAQAVLDPSDQPDARLLSNVNQPENRMTLMKAAVFVEPGRIVIDDKPVPSVGPLDALMRVTTTTICGTDVHILKGEYPVAKGLTIGHEPVGVIEKLGSSVTGYHEGQRVIAGAITPSGWSNACLCGQGSQDGAGTAHGWQAMGGWKFGNTIDGCQAEYVLVPDAMANLAPVPDGLSDEQVLMCPDIMSTGFSGAESAGIRIGDVVAVFAQGPIGLCATAGAKLSGASVVIGVDRLPDRLAMAGRMGADHMVDSSKVDPVEEILRLTGGRGVDVAIEALGTQSTFEAALRVLRPGGTLSSLGVYSTDLKIPLGAFAAGLGDHRIITTLCPGGKERMRRLMSVIEGGRVDFGAMVTHRFKLDDIEAAYDLFSHQRDGVLKVALTP